MKLTKIFLMGAAVLGASLASCQQDTGDLGKVQVNPQEPVIEGANGVTVNLASEAQQPIDLGYKLLINGAACMVNMADVAPAEGLPEGAKLAVSMELASKADYSDAIEYELTDNDDVDGATEYAIAPSLLQEYFRNTWSKYQASAQTCYVRFAVQATIPVDGIATATCVRLGGPDYWYLNGATITLVPQVQAHLMLGTPGANGQDAASSMKLVSANAENTSYNGLVYVANPFTIEEIGGDLKLGAGSTPEELTVGGTSPIAVPADGAGLYYISINKTDDTTWSIAMTRVDTIGCIGDFNSWGGDAALTPNADFTVWTGDVDFAVAGGWKFRMNGGWDINLGGEQLSDLSFNGPNCTVEETGTYTVTLYLGSLPYHATMVKK